MRKLRVALVLLLLLAFFAVSQTSFAMTTLGIADSMGVWSFSLNGLIFSQAFAGLALYSIESDGRPRECRRPIECPWLYHSRPLRRRFFTGRNPQFRQLGHD